MTDIIERMNEAMGEYEKALRKYGNPLAKDVLATKARTLLPEAIEEIKRLEAKLAKAVGALGDIYDGEPEWPSDPQKELDWCRNRAKRAIAELKGHNDE